MADDGSGYDDPVCFSSAWEGKAIDFKYKDPESKFIAGTWKLGKKQYERPRLATNWEFSMGLVSESEAMFECNNTDNPDETALMIIYMQVPRRSTEFLPPSERKAQATDKLPHAPANQLWALTTLHKHNSHSSLKLYGYKKSKQNDSGLVPGGYILYLLVQKYPGVSLTEDSFWQLSLPERDEIRQALKATLLDCLDKGINNYEDDISKIRWMREKKKVVITRFHACSPKQDGEDENGEDEWRDNIWYYWGLVAKKPDWRYDKNDNGKKLDPSRWVL